MDCRFILEFWGYIVNVCIDFYIYIVNELAIKN